MQLSDTLIQEKKTVFSQVSDSIASAIETPLGMLASVLVGPFFFACLIALSTLSSFLLSEVLVVSIAGVYLLLSWKEKGLYGAIGLTAVAYVIRLVWGVSEQPLWELFFAVSHSATFFLTYQTFEECQAQIEETTVSLEKDFERLKKVHATYTKEKARECEELQASLIEARDREEDKRAEIDSLKSVVLESSAFAARLQDQVSMLEQDVSAALQREPKENPINQTLLKEVNELRVTVHQRQQLIDELVAERDALKTEQYKAPEVETPEASAEPAPVEEMHASSVSTADADEAVSPLAGERVQEADSLPGEETAQEPVEQESKQPAEMKKPKLSKNALLLQRLGAHPPKASPKGELESKEQEKIRIKKEYYALLDECNDFKADPEKKDEYDQSFELLRIKKAELVQVEKELFSIKKELRDSGKLFS